MIQTFEQKLFPRDLRWRYALSNVASDARTVEDSADEIQLIFRDNASRFYPGYERTMPKAQIGVVSLMIPVGCNATCPRICYTNMMNWKASPEHLAFSELLALLGQCKKLGCRLLRIIGDGEPTLYPYFSELSSWCRDREIPLLLFTNGVIMKQNVLEEYAKGGVYVYVKLWSESVDMQTKLVAPRLPYHFVDGEVGFAPMSFYQLREIDRSRVGFQVMISSANYNDAISIVNGVKRDTPMLVESFIPEGSGMWHRELIPDRVPVTTKACEAPPRSSYLAVVNSRGQLQAGTFVSEQVVAVKEMNLADVWGSVFTRHKLFFLSRYTGGCFCEAQRYAASKNSD